LRQISLQFSYKDNVRSEVETNTLPWFAASINVNACKLVISEVPL